MKPVLVLLLALALLAVGYLALRGLEGDEEPLSVAGLPAGPGRTAPEDPPEEVPLVRPEGDRAGPGGAGEDQGGRIGSAVPVEEDPWLSPEEEAAAPPDPILRGNGILVLRLRNRASAMPVESTVHLWRIGAPANDAWSEGDQLQAEAFVGEQGYQFPGLPEGRYRAVILAQRYASPDPYEFQVTGTFMRVDLPVDLPQERPVHCRVYDAKGQPITSTRSVRGRAAMGERDPTPAWLTPRRLLSSGKSRAPRGGVPPRPRIPEPRGGVPLSARPRSGFPLGSFREDSRCQANSEPVLLRIEGGCDVEVRVDGGLAGTSYAGVSVDPSPLEALVLLPDNRPARAEGAWVRVTSLARPLSQELGARPWERIPIQVRAVCAGHRDLVFSFTLEEGPPEYVRMEAVP